MTTPPSSSPPQSPDPDPTTQDPEVLTTTTTPQKKPQPVPWTHQETSHLIQAYQEKWYSLKRGPLKSSQWEEVAITVAARCGYEEPSKSATQCRHKMEKLRKRYRAEMQLRRPSSWPFFDLMDRLMLGPLPISARPMTIIKCQNSEDFEDKEVDVHVHGGDEDEDSDDERHNNKSKSINYILRTPTIVNRKLNEVAAAAGGIGEIRKRGEPAYAAVAVAEEGEEMEGGKRMLSELAAEIRTFAERFVRMENVKMEMMRETERYRMEMENKRTEMILDSQRKIVDTIGKALGSHKKLKITSTTHHV